MPNPSVVISADEESTAASETVSAEPGAPASGEAAAPEKTVKSRRAPKGGAKKEEAAPVDLGNTSFDVYSGGVYDTKTNTSVELPRELVTGPINPVAIQEEIDSLKQDLPALETAAGLKSLSASQKKSLTKTLNDNKEKISALEEALAEREKILGIGPNTMVARNVYYNPVDYPEVSLRVRPAAPMTPAPADATPITADQPAAAVKTTEAPAPSSETAAAPGTSTEQKTGEEPARAPVNLPEYFESLKAKDAEVRDLDKNFGRFLDLEHGAFMRNLRRVAAPLLSGWQAIRHPLIARAHKNEQVAIQSEEQELTARRGSIEQISEKLLEQRREVFAKLGNDGQTTYTRDQNTPRIIELCSVPLAKKDADLSFGSIYERIRSLQNPEARQQFIEQSGGILKSIEFGPDGSVHFTRINKDNPEMTESLSWLGYRRAGKSSMMLNGIKCSAWNDDAIGIIQNFGRGQGIKPPSKPPTQEMVVLDPDSDEMRKKYYEAQQVSQQAMLEQYLKEMSARKTASKAPGGEAAGADAADPEETAGPDPEELAEIARQVSEADEPLDAVGTHVEVVNK